MTFYRVAKDAGVDWGTLQRFVDGARPNIRIDTVGKLCECLGLELQTKKERAAENGRDEWGPLSSSRFNHAPPGCRFRR